MKGKILRRLAPPIAPVPRLWPDSLIVCIATGPSLTTQDVEFCRGKARVIAVNDSYRLAPWADVLYAADGEWWMKHWNGNPYGLQSFAGLKYHLSGVHRGLPPSVARLRNSGADGLDRDPTALRRGGHSGYQAINLAVHLGARTIVLLGYDLQCTGGKAHWFGKHVGLRDTNPALYPQWAKTYQTMVEPLAKLKITVWNCTRETALTAFPRADLATVLGREQAVA